MGHNAPEDVKGFFGENRLAPDDLLPAGISPDALNVDYRRGTILSRAGFLKLHTLPALTGGVRIDNSASARTIWVPHHADYNFSGEFTIECLIRVVTYSGGFRLIFKLPSSGSVTSGWTLNGSNGSFVFSMVDGGGTPRNTASKAYETGRWYHVAIRRDSSNNLTMYVDGVSAGAAVTCTGHTSTSTPIWFDALGGAAPANVTASVVYDEFRIYKDYRTDAELAECRYRELRDDEIEDANLIAYHKMNDGMWNTVTDSSKNKNHGAFYAGGPSFCRGLVPLQASEGWAARFDGIDDYGSAPYHADYAPVLNTSNVWTLELWLRLDTLNYDVSGGSRGIIHFGSLSTGNGAVVGLHLSAAGGGILSMSYSTTTTKTNFTQSTGYELIPGVPVHVAVTRNAGTVKVYINGELMLTDATATTENGPTSSTSYGMFFGGRNSAGTWDSRFAPVTLDEVRLWKEERSQALIQNWMNRAFPDAKHSQLLGLWRFDQGDKEKDETFRSAAVFKADGAQPNWSFGYAYPIAPERMLLLAPQSRVNVGNEVLAGSNSFDRELLFGTKAFLYTLVGTEVQPLRKLDYSGELCPFDWCRFLDKLIFCNGLDPNYKYDGANVPQACSIAQPSAAPSVALGGAGAITGTVRYRVQFRNTADAEI
ncbi:MAG: LamG domain-containing protein, partial [Candidatus Hydrogenedentes bacterium]|nr:LamG domain-containing protein [Candidatus Hydrogenedentota bacterium]